MIDAAKIKPYRIRRRLWRFSARSYQVITGKRVKPRTKLEVCEVWSGHATLVILVGIISEIDPVIGSLWPNVLIAVGLAIEYFCIQVTIRGGREYQAESDAKVAAANERAALAFKTAAEAQLALEKFKAPRILSPEARARITAAVSQAANTEFDIATGPLGDPEPPNLGAVLSSILTKAGWVQIAWKTSDNQFTLEKPGKPTFGFAAVTNVIIDIDPAQASRLWPIAQKLAAALNAEGIAADAQQGSGGKNTNENAIHVMIGRRM